MRGKNKTNLIYILIMILSVYAFGKDPNTITKEPNENSEAGAEREIVTGPKAWALACGGILNERNHGYHDSLITEDLTGANIKKAKKLLDDFWDIKDVNDLKENLRWLINRGHRAAFSELGNALKAGGEEAYNEAIKRLEAEPQIKMNRNQIKQRIEYAKKYYDELGKKSLIGWDYCRLIMLCRWSYMAGYTNEKEAWVLIMAAAAVLQETFDSWEDLGKNYIIGRQFWSYRESRENGELYDEAFVRMLEMRSSPWNIYPWNMDLTKGKDVEKPNNN